jgi:Xaa-Pro aminopeptidase
MRSGAIAVINLKPEKYRDGDSTHMYRQDFDFYYLTGVEEAETVAVLDADSKHAYTMYARKRDLHHDVYNPIGQFSKEQQAIYELVLKAQNAAIELVKPSRVHHEGFDADMRILSNGLIDLGLLNGDKDSVYKSGAYSCFTMHGISLWIGLDVYDKDDYQMETGKRGGQRVLVLGMAWTLEHGIYIPQRYQ